MPNGLIGSIRRECLDHIVVLGEAHLRRILRSYARYYNDIRTQPHLPDLLISRNKTSRLASGLAPLVSRIQDVAIVDIRSSDKVDAN